MPDLFPSAGGRYTLTVSAPAGCAWSARSESDAADVSPVSGAGAGTVTLTVQPHGLTTEGRSVTVTIGDTSQRVTQVAAACTVSVSPTSLDVSKNAENREIALSIPAGCTWRATTNVDWIVNIAPPSGTGAATIHFLVQANDKGDIRTGEVVVAGVKVPVRQARND
jgi:hypothetical protein